MNNKISMVGKNMSSYVFFFFFYSSIEEQDEFHNEYKFSLIIMKDFIKLIRKELRTFKYSLQNDHWKD